MRCGADPLLDGRFRLDAAVGPRRYLATLVNPNPRLGDAPGATARLAVVATPPGEAAINRARLQLRSLRRAPRPPLTARQELVVTTPAGPALYAAFEVAPGQAPAALDEAQALALARAGERLLDALHGMNPPLTVGLWEAEALRWDGLALVPLGLGVGSEQDLLTDMRGLAALVRQVLLGQPTPGGALAGLLDNLERGGPLGSPSLGDDAPTALLRKARSTEEHEDKATEVIRLDALSDLDPMLDSGLFRRPELTPPPDPPAAPPAARPLPSPPPLGEEDEDEEPSRAVLWVGLGLMLAALVVVAVVVFGR